MEPADQVKKFPCCLWPRMKVLSSRLVDLHVPLGDDLGSANTHGCLWAVFPVVGGCQCFRPGEEEDKSSSPALWPPGAAAEAGSEKAWQEGAWSGRKGSSALRRWHETLRW